VFGSRITLFRVAGMAIRIDASWIFLVVLVTWSLASSYFPAQVRGLPPRLYWAMGAIGAVGLFASILFHELSHAVVARRSGVPMNGITLFIFGGVAEMEEEPQEARTELRIALAGPLATVVLVLVLFPLAALMRRQQWPVMATETVGYLAMVNLVLLLFNLVPAFPLDGGRVLRAALWGWKGNVRWATRVASRIGAGFGLALIFLGVFRVVVGDFIGGIWSFLIGSFLRNAASMSYQQVVLREALRGSPVRRFMKADVVTVPRETSVADLVENYFYKHHYRMFPVVAGERVVGCVSPRDVSRVPREEWNSQTVGTIAEKCDPQNSISADMDAVDALARMHRTGSSHLLVMEGDHLAGLLTLQDLLRFLAMKVELEDQASGPRAGSG
jgi:Zn-dependent protease/predicted transcriptional regulator